MALLMVDREKVAIPLGAPAVYNYRDGELEGGTAEDMACQVISSLKKMKTVPCRDWSPTMRMDSTRLLASFKS